MTVEFIHVGGQKMAVLPAADYETLLDLVEDRVDAVDAVAAERRRLEGEPYLSSEYVDRLLAGEQPLKVWRQFRQLTLEELADRVGGSKQMLSHVERGLRVGSVELWSALAVALGVTIEDIRPIS